MPKVKDIFSYRIVRIYIILKTVFDVITIASKVANITPFNEVSWIVTVYTVIPIVVTLMYAMCGRTTALKNVVTVSLFSPRKRVRNTFRLLTILVVTTMYISKIYGDTVEATVMVTILVTVLAWELTMRKKLMNRYFIFIPEKRAAHRAALLLFQDNTNRTVI